MFGEVEINQNKDISLGVGKALNISPPPFLFSWFIDSSNKWEPMKDTQLLICYYQIKLSAPSEWSITWNPRQTAQRGKLFSCAGVNRNACFSCHVSPWSPQLHQKRARLTMTVSEVNYYRTFSVLFFPITVIWRETRYSACVNGFLSPSTFLLCRQQRLDDLFSECSVPTGGLFQPNFAQHFFSPRPPDSRPHFRAEPPIKLLHVSLSLFPFPN